MASPIVQAIKQICDEKHISYESVLETVEAALAAAYRKDFGEKNQNIKVSFDPETGSMRAFDVKIVIEDMELTPEELAGTAMPEPERKPKIDRKMKIEKTESATPAAGPEEPKWNPKTMVMISEAKKIKRDAVLGEEIRTELAVPGAFGRMAAQTAKQVIMQKIREAEREVVYNEFRDKEGQVLVATVQRREGRVVLFDLGRATAVMPPEEQAPHEQYGPGVRMKVYVVRVALTTKGPEIVVSRTNVELIRKLFTIEIPEVASGAVEIKAIAREAGARSKVAVMSADASIDPIGSCIGQRGTRIQTITSELGGEKIDIIAWHEDPQIFIGNALSPAKVQHVEANTDLKNASVRVATDQLSLAIGRGGQNVRLAARLTGWNITVVGASVEGEAVTAAETAPTEEVTKDDEAEVAPVKDAT